MHILWDVLKKSSISWKDFHWFSETHLTKFILGHWIDPRIDLNLSEKSITILFVFHANYQSVNKSDLKILCYDQSVNKSDLKILCYDNCGVEWFNHIQGLLPWKLCMVNLWNDESWINCTFRYCILLYIVHIDGLLLAHWLLTPLLDGTLPLPEPLLTCHQRYFVCFTAEQYRKKSSWTVRTESVTCVLSLHFDHYYREQWVNSHILILLITVNLMQLTAGNHQSVLVSIGNHLSFCQ